MTTTVATPPPQTQIARLMNGYLTTQLLYVAVELGLADCLADGARSSAEIAQEIVVDPSALHRVLRGLAAEGVFDEQTDGRFALNPLSECLRQDVPGSMRPGVAMRGSVYYGAAAELLYAVRTGGNAFEHHFGTTFFGYLNENSAQGGAFHAFMAERSRQEAADVVASYDFRGIGHLVDVGGGVGVLMEAILRSASSLRGTIFDQPAVSAAAADRLQAAGFADRCDVVAGDFFAAVPSGGDVYLMSRILHDWDDADCRRILTTCHSAMGPGSLLLLVEAVLPELAASQPSIISMDLHMMLLLGGRERTKAEFAALLGQTGFRLRRVVPTKSLAGVSIIEAQWVPVG